MGGVKVFSLETLHKTGAPVVNYAINFSPLLGQHNSRECKGSYIPATTVSARGSLCKTWCMRPTSVQAWRFRTLLRRIAINTDHISACNNESLINHMNYTIIMIFTT